MKLKLNLRSMAAAGLALGTLGAAQTAMADVTLNYATYHAKAAPAQALIEGYLDEMAAQSDGEITIGQRFYMGALLKPAEALKGIGSGIAHVGHFCTGNHPAELPLSALAEVPFVVEESGDAVSIALANLYENNEAFRTEYDRANVVPLTWDISVPTIIGVNKEINSAEDLNGLKVRAYGVVGTIVSKGGGMVPVTMGATEVLTSLQTGALDGYTGSTFWMPAVYDWMGNTKTIVNPRIGPYYTCGLVMNKDVYETLSDNAKSLIQEMRKTYWKRGVELFMEADLKTVEAAKAANVSFYTFTPEEIEAWMEKANVDEIIESMITTAQGSTDADARAFFEAFKAEAQKQEEIATYKLQFPQ